MRRWQTFLFIFFTQIVLSAQEKNVCIPILGERTLSPRIANYIMDLDFDAIDHQVTGSERINWLNNSPDTIYSIRLYMYVNAFKNAQSSYLNGSGMNVMGQDLSGRKKEDWGWIKVNRAVQEEVVLNEMRYVQPDDGNVRDQSVLEIVLGKPILPGQELNLILDFTTRLPRIISRVGFAEHGYHHFVHWYPKMGVYEQDDQGTWGWNCHQFLRQMEFYGDHGNYEISITHDPKYVLGGSGCREIYKQAIIGEEGRVRTHFNAQDVIDFGWVASPNLVEYEDQWKHVEIRLLSPRAHRSLVPRFLEAAKHAMTYLEDHVGIYPYNTLTILDPPIHGLRSGFMEYPTYITGGSFYSFPKGVRSMESLIIHEFTHQYFMQMLASNEKEAPWLDEGFVTFYEDCIMEDAYGDASLIDIFGYRVRNSSLTRNEYASLPNLSINPITVPSWEIKGSYKGIVYSKTATVLQTLKRYLGEEHFDEMMRFYFEKNKFTHPRKEDFLSAVRMEFEQHKNILSPVIDQFLKDVLDDTKVCDYAVTKIRNQKKAILAGGLDITKEESIRNQTVDFKDTFHNAVTLERKGTLIVPVEFKITWSDKSVTNEIWDGKETIFDFQYTSKLKIIAAEIDPERKLFLDIDFNNNSLSEYSDKGGIWKYAMRSVYWVQNAIQSTSFLM